LSGKNANFTNLTGFKNLSGLHQRGFQIGFVLIPAAAHIPLFSPIVILNRKSIPLPNAWTTEWSRQR